MLLNTTKSIITYMTSQVKEAIIVDSNPETGDINISADVDGDGVPDIKTKFSIKDKRFWTGVLIIMGIIVATKGAGLW